MIPINIIHGYINKSIFLSRKCFTIDEYVLYERSWGVVVGFPRVNPYISQKTMSISSTLHLVNIGTHGITPCATQLLRQQKIPHLDRYGKPINEIE